MQKGSDFMAIYLLILFFLTGTGFLLTEKQKIPRPAGSKAFVSLSFMILLCLSSFRYAIGFDYFSYRDIYRLCGKSSFVSILKYCWYEPLFFICCRLCSLLGLSFQIFLTLVNAFLLFAAMQFIYRHSLIPWMSVFLFIALQFLAYDMNLIRQAIAVCFFLYAAGFIKSRNIIPYTVLLFAGGLFHNSLWFMYPLYFLLPRKFSKKTITALCIAAGILYLFFDQIFALAHPLLPEKYAVYQQTYFWNSSTWEYLLPPALYCLLICGFQNRITDPESRSVYVNSAWMNLLISLFLTKHFILERLAVYPFVFSLTAVPAVTASFRAKDPSAKKQPAPYYFVMLLFVLFGLFYFFFAALKGFHHVYPYISLLEKSRSSGF